MSRQKNKRPHDLSVTTKEVVDEFVKELKVAIVADIENGIQKERSLLHKRVKDVLELPNFESTSRDGQEIQGTQPSYIMVVYNFEKKLCSAIDSDIKSRIIKERVLLHKKVQKLIEMPEFATISQVDLNLNDFSAFVNIRVKNLAGYEEFFMIKRDSKLRKPIMDYCERLSFDIHERRFICGGRQIDYEKTPDQLKLKDGDVIHVFLKQRGGP